MNNSTDRPAPKPRTLVRTATGSTYVIELPMYFLPFTPPPYVGTRRPERGEAYDKGPRDKGQLTFLERPAIDWHLVFEDANSQEYRSSRIVVMEETD